MLPQKAQIIKPDIRFYMDLCPAADEDVEAPAFQEELKKLFRDLRAKGVEVSPSYYVINDVYGGGGLSGEFFLPALKMIEAPVLDVLGDFFQAHPGRKTRLKIGDVDTEVGNAGEVKALLAKAGDYLKER